MTLNGNFWRVIEALIAVIMAGLSAFLGLKVGVAQTETALVERAKNTAEYRQVVDKRLDRIENNVEWIKNYLLEHKEATKQ